jgi:hypothetical protein
MKLQFTKFGIKQLPYILTRKVLCNQKKDETNRYPEGDPY